VTRNLTVVLPVYNAEATLSRDVTEVLEVAGELAGSVRLFIVDDGSIDDTYDTAAELSFRYPQVHVLRHAERRGLGQAIEALRAKVAGDFVLVHDGASRIDAHQIRQLWFAEQSRAASFSPVSIAATAKTKEPVTIDDLRFVSAMHGSMAAAHARLAGFQRLLVTPVETADRQLTRRDRERRKGVGVIPPLPRPNFMGALANFALGE
jgi:glycosyltransferase involved in cell wall biosynthesis